MKRISVICVEIMGSGNIGSVARAMKNMGVSDLILVNPQAKIDEDTKRMAVGAYDIVERARIVDSLDEIQGEFNLLIGTSARSGKLRQNILTPREFALKFVEDLEYSKIGLLFGREDSGLSREDLFMCDFIIRIPTVKDFKSLNISQAVLIVLYELFLMKSGIKKFPSGIKSKLSTSFERELLFSHIEDVLLNIGFLHKSNPKRIMFTIRQIFSRCFLSKRDVQILHGMFSQFKVFVEKSNVNLKK